MKVMISGYGRMGHMVEKALAAKGVECAGWTEDVASVDKALAKECVCIDFTVPEAFRANYKVLAEKFGFTPEAVAKKIVDHFSGGSCGCDCGSCGGCH